MDAEEELLSSSCIARSASIVLDSIRILYRALAIVTFSSAVLRRCSVCCLQLLHRAYLRWRGTRTSQTKIDRLSVCIHLTCQFEDESIPKPNCDQSTTAFEIALAAFRHITAFERVVVLLIVVFRHSFFPYLRVKGNLPGGMQASLNEL